MKRSGDRAKRPAWLSAAVVLAMFITTLIVANVGSVAHAQQNITIGAAECDPNAPGAEGTVRTTINNFDSFQKTYIVGVHRANDGAQVHAGSMVVGANQQATFTLAGIPDTTGADWSVKVRIGSVTFKTKNQMSWNCAGGPILATSVNYLGSGCQNGAGTYRVAVSSAANVTSHYDLVMLFNGNQIHGGGFSVPPQGTNSFTLEGIPATGAILYSQVLTPGGGVIPGTGSKFTCATQAFVEGSVWRATITSTSCANGGTMTVRVNNPTLTARQFEVKTDQHGQSNIYMPPGESDFTLNGINTGSRAVRINLHDAAGTRELFASDFTICHAQ